MYSVSAHCGDPPHQNYFWTIDHTWSDNTAGSPPFIQPAPLYPRPYPRPVPDPLIFIPPYISPPLKESEPLFVRCERCNLKVFPEDRYCVGCGAPA